MKTRCKFECRSVTDHGDSQEVKFGAVMKNSDESCENSKFWKWTPSGTLEFQTINKDVKFEAGKEYYIDISLAE